MPTPFVSSRRVKIGDTAAIVGTTPRAIRHYHDIGLLPEPERGTDDRRRYGYEDMVRLLWILKMADAGIALDDIREAFGGDASGGTESSLAFAGILERLESSLAAQEAELQRQRIEVQRMRIRGHKAGLLSDVVADRLDRLPEGSVREAELDSLLVMERMFGPLGAAAQSTRFIALATHADLREESDRVDALEEALDDTVAVDDPRVPEAAAARHAFDQRLHAIILESGLQADDDALFDEWNASHPETDDGAARGAAKHTKSGRALAAMRALADDYSPARLRCFELTHELAARGDLLR